MVVMASNSGTVTLGDIADRLLMLGHLPHFENWARRLAVGIERICLKCVSAVMEGAQRFRERELPQNGLSVMKADAYTDMISMLERAHRRFLDLVKLDLEGSGVRDINNVQALILFNIGDAEMTVGELTVRGCYLGSNVTYNVKKMVENDYLATERSIHDLRSIHVKLTDKGRMLRNRLSVMNQRHVKILNQAGITEADLQRVTAVLGRLERFWIGASQPQRRFAEAG